MLCCWIRLSSWAANNSRGRTNIKSCTHRNPPVKRGNQANFSLFRLEKWGFADVTGRIGRSRFDAAVKQAILLYQIRDSALSLSRFHWCNTVPAPLSFPEPFDGSDCNNSLKKWLEWKLSQDSCLFRSFHALFYKREDVFDCVRKHTEGSFS